MFRHFWMSHWKWVVVLVTVITSWESDLKREGFIWDHCLRAQFTMTGNHSGRDLKQLLTLYLQLGSKNPSSGHTTVPSEMKHYLPPLPYPTSHPTKDCSPLSTLPTGSVIYRGQPHCTEPAFTPESRCTLAPFSHSNTWELGMVVRTV